MNLDGRGAGVHITKEIAPTSYQLQGHLHREVVFAAVCDPPFSKKKSDPEAGGLN
jgi:hypothetical protein